MKKNTTSGHGETFENKLSAWHRLKNLAFFDIPAEGPDSEPQKWDFGMQKRRLKSLKRRFCFAVSDTP